MSFLSPLLFQTAYIFSDAVLIEFITVLPVFVALLILKVYPVSPLTTKASSVLNLYPIVLKELLKL